jgi:hypothetical protein
MELRRYRETDVFFGNDLTGTFNFDGTWTRGPLDNSPTAPQLVGQSFASFLLGLPSSGSVNRPAGYDERSTTWGFYLQDDWKIGPRVTLNLGVRYEVETALTELQNRSVRGFDFAAVQPIEAAAQARLNPTATGVPADRFAVRGGLTFPGVDGQPRGLYETPKGNVMPRAGIAYRIDDKTVVRTGYGMFYGSLGQRRGDVLQSGFNATTSLVPSLNNGVTFIETLSNPFQNGIQEPLGAARGIETFLGQSITFFDPNPKSPRNQRWQVGVQRELGTNWVAEIAYVGNYGSQLQTTRNLNATPLEFLSTSGVRDQPRIDFLSAQVPNPFFGLMPTTAGSAFRGATIARERLLRPYPHFDAVNTTTNEGRSWYHALQLGAQRRFSAGYMIAANYTYSRFTQATEFLTAADPEPTRVISDQDAPHRLSVSGIWELPFGEGRRFGRDLPPLVSNILIGGWQVSGIYAYQSGVPIGFGNLLFTGNLDDVALSADEQSVGRWFNTDAGFNRVSNQQLGSNVRTFPLRLDSVRTDPVNNIDLSLIKNTSLARAKVLQLRFEALNAFNHVLFPGPNTDPLAVAFGRIVSSTQVNYPRRVQVMAKFIF